MVIMERRDEVNAALERMVTEADGHAVTSSAS